MKMERGFVSETGIAQTWGLRNLGNYYQLWFHLGDKDVEYHLSASEIRSLMNKILNAVAELEAENEKE